MGFYLFGAKLKIEANSHIIVAGGEREVPAEPE